MSHRLKSSTLVDKNGSVLFCSMPIMAVAPASFSKKRTLIGPVILRPAVHDSDSRVFQKEIGKNSNLGLYGDIQRCDSTWRNVSQIHQGNLLHCAPLQTFFFLNLILGYYQACTLIWSKNVAQTNTAIYKYKKNSLKCRKEGTWEWSL